MSVTENLTPREVDFSKVDDRSYRPSGFSGTTGQPSRDRDGNMNAPRTPEGKLLTAKQIRARARRKSKRMERMTDQEFEALYKKPIEEWDLEELAHGRTRNAKGKFTGPSPKWINREGHERSMERFKSVIKSRMNVLTPDAITAVDWIISNEEVDERGKPIIPPSTKLDAAKWLLEHTVGKPTQRIESDISVKLQAILGVAMANPAEALMTPQEGGQGYTLGHLPGVTLPMGASDDIVDADEVEENG